MVDHEKFLGYLREQVDRYSETAAARKRAEAVRQDAQVELLTQFRDAIENSLRPIICEAASVLEEAGVYITLKPASPANNAAVLSLTGEAYRSVLVFRAHTVRNRITIHAARVEVGKELGGREMELYGVAEAGNGGEVAALRIEEFTPDTIRRALFEHVKSITE